MDATPVEIDKNKVTELAEIGQKQEVATGRSNGTSSRNKKIIVITVGMFLMIAIGLGGGFFVLRDKANAAADVYTSSIKSYLSQVYDAMAPTDKAPIDVKNSISQLVRPQLQDVFMGYTNPHYVDAQSLSTNSNNKVDAILSQFDGYVAVYNYTSTYKQSMSDLNLIKTDQDSPEFTSAVLKALGQIKSAIDNNQSNFPNELKPSFVIFSNIYAKIIDKYTILIKAYKSGDQAVITKASKDFSDTYSEQYGEASRPIGDFSIKTNMSNSRGDLKSYLDRIKVNTDVSNTKTDKITSQTPSNSQTNTPINKQTIIQSSNQTNSKPTYNISDIKQVTAGTSHTCGIGPDNLAYCWGVGKYGQLGNDSDSTSTSPVRVDTSGVLNGKTIQTITAGDVYTCVIASDQQVYCWGANSGGQLGDGSNSGRNRPVAVYTGGVLKGKTIKSVAVGVSHTCAVASDDQAYCWGFNSYNGRLGNNSDKESNVPVTVDTSGVLSGKTIKSISVGSGNTCAIASDNQAYCWGDGYYGLLGNNTKTFSFVPVAVYKDGALKGKTIKSIDTYPFAELNTDHVCVIASDNNKYCWGHDEAGATKLGEYRYNAVPTLAP